MKEVDIERAHLLEPDLILAITVYGEARGEPLLGKIAVAHVVNNRVKDNRWPNTMVDVCLQPKQFSCWNENDPNYSILTRKLWQIKSMDQTYSWKECLFAAVGVVRDYIKDLTEGANHYHTKSIHPSWADKMVKTVEIGNHIFYRG
jgi:spore germination cell wall hydrolase CwlJ-like protein